MYKTAFEPLCNSIERTLRLGGHPLFFRELVVAIPYKYPLPLNFLTPLFASRLPVDRFVSVCEYFLCFGATGRGTLEVSLQGGNAQLPSSLITLLCCSIFVLVVVLA
jgi:hypothetical protein